MSHHWMRKGTVPVKEKGHAWYDAAEKKLYVFNGHDWTEVPSSGGGGPVSWNDVTDKPSTFPPSAHTHEIGDVDGLSDELTNLQNSIDDKVDSSELANYATTEDLSDGLSSKADAEAAMPPGGAEGQVLSKASGDDYDVEWVDAGSSSGNVSTEGLTAGTIPVANDDNEIEDSIIQIDGSNIIIGDAEDNVTLRANGGNLTIQNALNHDINVVTNDASAAESSGSVEIKSGNVVEGESGNILLISGDSSDSDTGDVSLSTGISHSASGTAGNINLWAGFNSVEPSQGGSVAIHTNDIERFRVMPSGALAVDYTQDTGVAGQVLTSSGEDAPPAWTTIETPPAGYSYNSFDGRDINLTVQPDGNAGVYNLHNTDASFDPASHSPNETWTLHRYYANLDPDSSGHSWGTDGQALNLLNLNLDHHGTSSVGQIAFLNTYFSIGNGSDPINVSTLAYSFGFGNINENVTINDSVQGYGFQPQMHENAVMEGYINSFYDHSTWNCPVSWYTSFSASPTIKGIKNNFNFTGISISPNIEEMQGNANFNGLAISPTIGAFGESGGFNGVLINPNADGFNWMDALHINLSNATPKPGAQASLEIQDLTITFNQAGETGNSISIEYVGGGTAGSEMVSGGPAVVVQIEDGVSTAEQIKDALEADFLFAGNLTVEITGTASNPQVIQAQTFLDGGIWPGNRRAIFAGGNVDIQGNVNIDGDLSFSGGFSIGKLNAFAPQELVDTGGNPESVHMLISQPYIGDNETLTTADVIGLNTAALINVGENSTVGTAFLGIAALGLPAVVSIGEGSFVDRIAGAAFAISLDAGQTGNGTVDSVSLCRALGLPNGTTTVNKLRGYEMDLPFGSVGTVQHGVYIIPDIPNFFRGSVKIGGSGDVPTVGNRFEMEGGGFSLAADTTFGIFGQSPIVQQTSSGAQTAGGTYTSTEQTMIQEMYDALRAYGLLS